MVAPDEGSPGRPPKWQALEASAWRWQLAAAAAALLCLLVVMLQARPTGLSLGLVMPSLPPPQLRPKHDGPTGSSQQPVPGQHPPPLPCLFNTLLRVGDVRWSTTANGAADRLSVNGCELRRYSAAEARQCLAGKRLVFVGDSVTRYQYLTLLHFLDRDVWPAPLGGVPGEPSVANEHEWPSWNDFLKGTSQLFGGRELCDCFREDREGWKPPEDEKFENRFYSRGNVSISHFTYTTEPNTVHGHFGFPPYQKGRRPCAPATCAAPADWEFELATALTHPIKAMRPTHLVLNTGLWGSSNAFGNSTWAKVAQAGRLAVGEQEGRVIWRTTTASVGRFPTTRDHDALALLHTAGQGWGVMDSFALTRPLLKMPNKPLWDGRHFLAVVYRELNMHLLNMICHPLA